MKTRLIGEKQIFAIEIKFVKRKSFLFGNSRLWIQGKYIGCINEECVIGPFISILGNIQSSQISKDLHFGVVDLELMNKIDELDSHSFSECYDDFILKTIRFENKILFYWKLEKSPFHNYQEYIEYGAAEFFAFIPFTVFNQVYDEVKFLYNTFTE